eukprot:14638538-Ditylum_brightwellii.AAC.1
MGVFRWMIELGRIDILTEASHLASHQALSHEGHLDTCYSIFAYLRKHPTMATVLHLSQVHVNEDWFKDADWVDFYDDVTEEIPVDMPEPLGNSVQMTA